MACLIYMFVTYYLQVYFYHERNCIPFRFLKIKMFVFSDQFFVHLLVYRLSLMSNRLSCLATLTFRFQWTWYTPTPQSGNPYMLKLLYLKYYFFRTCMLYVVYIKLLANLCSSKYMYMYRPCKIELDQLKYYIFL